MVAPGMVPARISRPVALAIPPVVPAPTIEPTVRSYAPRSRVAPLSRITPPTGALAIATRENGRPAGRYIVSCGPGGAPRSQLAPTEPSVLTFPVHVRVTPDTRMDCSPSLRLPTARSTE